MRSFTFAVVALGATLLMHGDGEAQRLTRGASSIALKSGETAEIGNFFWAVNCRSVLTAPPEVEVIEGPPEISLTIKPAMLLPRGAKCPNKVAGGILVITAKQIEEPSLSNLTVRILYKHKDGDRKFSEIYNLSLFP